MAHFFAYGMWQRAPYFLGGLLVLVYHWFLVVEIDEFAFRRGFFHLSISLRFARYLSVHPVAIRNLGERGRI